MDFIWCVKGFNSFNMVTDILNQKCAWFHARRLHKRVEFKCIWKIASKILFSFCKIIKFNW